MGLWTRKKKRAEQAASHTPPLGYVIHEVLGEGAEGCVYRATDNFFAREVVLKPMEVGRGHQNIDSIQRSMALANLIKSEFVNPAIAAVVQDKTIWLVGGFAEGISLRDVLSQSALDDDSLFHVVSDVVAGLDAIHSVGVVHNDLSPRNLIVGPKGITKITDFGASTRLGDPCPGAGTPGYIAPEKVGGQPSTYALDSFSLGALIARVLGGDTIDVGAGRRFELPPVDQQPTRLRRELARLAHELMDSDPKRRPGTTAVLHTLQRVARATNPGGREALGALVRRQTGGQRNAVNQDVEPRIQLPSFWQRNRLAIVGTSTFLVTILGSAYLLQNPRLPVVEPSTLSSDVRASLPLALSLEWLDMTLTAQTQASWQRWSVFTPQTLRLSVKCSVSFCQLSLRHQQGNEVPHAHLAAISDFSMEDIDVWTATLDDMVYQSTIR